MNETDTCREYVLPKLEAAGWDYVTHPIIEQKRIFFAYKSMACKLYQRVAFQKLRSNKRDHC